MVFVQAILNGLLTASVGGVLGGAAVLWISLWSKDHGPDFDIALFRSYGLLLGATAGAIVGFAIGAICLPFMPFLTYWKGLGGAVCLIVGLAAVSGVVDWLLGDRPARLNGKLVELEYELRMPKDYPWPPAAQDVGDAPQIFLTRAAKVISSYPLPISAVSKVAERWTMRGQIPLETRLGDYGLNFALAKNAAVYFYLEGKPSEKMLNWSEWIGAGWDAGKPRPTPEQNFHLRYKLRYRAEEVVALAPPQPSAEEVAAAEFATLEPAAPLTKWIRFLRYDGPKDQVKTAAAVVAKRQDELAKLILATNNEDRELALGAVTYLVKPSPEVRAAILQEGRLLVAELRQFRQRTERDSAYYTAANDLRGRFNDWGHAWWQVRQSVADLDAGSLREILELTKDVGGDGAMGEVALNARVMVEKLETPQAVR